MRIFFSFPVHSTSYFPILFTHIKVSYYVIDSETDFTCDFLKVSFALLWPSQTTRQFPLYLSLALSLLLLSPLLFWLNLVFFLPSENHSCALISFDWSVGEWNVDCLFLHGEGKFCPFILLFFVVVVFLCLFVPYVMLNFNVTWL